MPVSPCKVLSVLPMDPPACEKVSLGTLEVTVIVVT